jgi:hypothetical protein
MIGDARGLWGPLQPQCIAKAEERGRYNGAKEEIPYTILHGRNTSFLVGQPFS